MEEALTRGYVILLTLTTVKAPRGVAPPKLPPNTMLPVPAVNVKDLFPFTVLESVIAPAPEPEERALLPVKVMALAKEMF